MSDTERMTPLLSLPFNSFLMLRLEYALLTGNDLQALLLRIIEKRMEDQRRRLYQERMNALSGTVPQEVVLDIPRDIWVPISHASFLYELYGLVQSENTLKKALRTLCQRKLILLRKGQGRYAPDEYQLNLKLLHEEFQRMRQQGKAGYQPLTPSEVETLMASSGDQALTPSEGQRLTPCKPARGSTIDPLRVSESDPSNRKITEEEFGEEAAKEGRTSPTEEVASAAAPGLYEGEVLLSGQQEPASEQTLQHMLPEQEHTQPTPAPGNEATVCGLSTNSQGSDAALHETGESSQTASPVSAASASPPSEQRVVSSSGSPAKGKTLLPETLVALVERLHGDPYDSSARVCQLEAARTLLAMNLVADLSTLERVYAACYDDWWRQHYGQMHLTHLLEREKSGQPRIVRLLARTTASRSQQYPLQPPVSAPTGSRGQPDQYAGFIARRLAEQRAAYQARFPERTETLPATPSPAGSGSQPDQYAAFVASRREEMQTGTLSKGAL